jgi:uncharacterized protein YozE (UPF0346 family)
MADQIVVDCPFTFVGEGEWIVMISAFFDESGKFNPDRDGEVKGHPTISFAGIAGTPNDFSIFNTEWNRHLNLNGLACLSMKDSLNHRKKLSPKRDAIGIKNRIHALKPFAECIRKHLQNVTNVTVDVTAWKKTPTHLRKLWSDDPIFMAFTRQILQVMGPMRRNDTINIACDDEEHTALPMYKLYRRVKLVYPDARKKLASINFADDEIFPQLQAADFVASLSRLEGNKRFHNEPNEYDELWETFGKPEREDRLWDFSGCFIDAAAMLRMADSEAKAQKQRGRLLEDAG